MHITEAQHNAYVAAGAPYVVFDEDGEVYAIAATEADAEAKAAEIGSTFIAHLIDA